MALPEYTDGVFELYRIENDESEDYPEEKLRDTGMRFWYRELAVYDTTRAKLSADSIEVTMKLAIPQYKKIDSTVLCWNRFKKYRKNNRQVYSSNTRCCWNYYLRYLRGSNLRP